MYVVMISVLMFGMPLVSAAVEHLAGGAPLTIVLLVKWFAFWAVGIRLLLAGAKQIFQPRYTDRKSVV